MSIPTVGSETEGKEPGIAISADETVQGVTEGKRYAPTFATGIAAIIIAQLFFAIGFFKASSDGANMMIFSLILYLVGCLIAAYAAWGTVKNIDTLAGLLQATKQK